jgi:hypothetical protein
MFDKAPVSEGESTVTILHLRERARLEREVASAIRREKEALKRASSIIDEEVAKIDLEKSKIIAGEISQKSVHAKEAVEKKERDDHKVFLNQRWERRSSPSKVDVTTIHEPATEEEVEALQKAKEARKVLMKERGSKFENSGSIPMPKGVATMVGTPGLLKKVDHNDDIVEDV